MHIGEKAMLFVSGGSRSSAEPLAHVPAGAAGNTRILPGRGDGLETAADGDRVTQAVAELERDAG
jgi:hypothetical protein